MDTLVHAIYWGHNDGMAWWMHPWFILAYWSLLPFIWLGIMQHAADTKKARNPSAPGRERFGQRTNQRIACRLSRFLNRSV